jgi:tetratricopeptide (TPR) repeat protein
MPYAKHTPSRAGRIARAVAVPAILILGATACTSGTPSSSDDTSSSTAPDAKKATQALDAGLKAHSDGDLEAAVESYNTVLEYDATNKFAFYNLALIDEAEGNYGLAEEKYRSALEADAEYEPALFNLAILRTDNDPEEAISLYKQAVAADKKDAAAWLNLGLLLRSNGQEREGDRDVLRAIALNPDLVDPAEAVSDDETTSP